MAVLVTGGAGYIGSVTVDELVAGGREVVVLDDLSTGYAEAVNPEVTFVEGDIGDEDLVRRIVDDHAVDSCVHFAGTIAVGESVAHPEIYFDVNVVRSLALMEALRFGGVRKVVFSSSAAVYGDPLEVPIPEDHPKAPTSPYGRTKLIFEGILEDYDVAHGFRSVALRYFNAAGGTERRSERHDPETHLIPLVLDAASGARDAITVFGTDYPTDDGSAVRDYIHVEDLAAAHVAALEYLDSGGLTDRFNLGTSIGHSVLEVIDASRTVTDRNIPVKLGERRAGDPAVLVADASRASTILDWSPRRSNDVVDIIASAWAHRPP